MLDPENNKANYGFVDNSSDNSDNEVNADAGNFLGLLGFMFVGWLIYQAWTYLFG